MRKHRGKIIIGVFIALVLTAAFFIGDGGGKTGTGVAPPLHADAETARGDDGGASDVQAGDRLPAIAGDPGGSSDRTGPARQENGEPAEGIHKSPEPQQDPAGSHEQGLADHSVPSGAGSSQDSGASEGTQGQQSAQGRQGDNGSSDGPVQEAPVKESESPPPQEVNADGRLTVTLFISVATILDNMDKLAEGKAGLIPADGVIFNGTVEFFEGESVFNVLSREVRKNRIHMESVNTPIYNSAYIKGINNIYEFDAGERSGWIYSVNGVFPNYGSSNYVLHADDVISWLFTCDRGADTNGGAGAADSYNWG